MHRWQFTATGGQPPYTFEAEGSGEITDDGQYTAPASPGAEGTVTVTDANLNTDSVSLQVGAPTIPMCSASHTREPILYVPDSGGMDLPYDDNEACQLTVAPLVGANPLNLTFGALDTDSDDQLVIHNGANRGAPELGTVSGTGPPGSFAASAGAMHFRWTSDDASVGSGWETLVTAGMPSGPQPLQLAPDALTVGKGSLSTVRPFLGVGPYSIAVLSGDGAIMPTADPYVWQFLAPNVTGATTLRVTDAMGNSTDGQLTTRSSFTLCQTDMLTSASSGVLYDSGGPTGYYQHDETCVFIVDPPAPGPIHITLEQFDLGHDGSVDGGEFFALNDGAAGTGPDLAILGADDTPTGEYTATQGGFLVYMETSPTVAGSGFTLTWWMD